MEKFLEFCKKHFKVFIVCAAVIVIVGIVVAVVLLNADDSSQPAVSSQNDTIAAVTGFSAFPEISAPSFETKAYSLNGFGDKSVTFKSFTADEEHMESEMYIYYAGSQSMNIMIYIENASDLLYDFSPEWITETYLPGKNSTTEELYHSTFGDREVYLALGHDTDGIYSGRGFVVEGDTRFIVSVSTVDIQPPKDDVQKQQIREASLLALSTFDIV